jgi:hypothetical protein
MIGIKGIRLTPKRIAHPIIVARMSFSAHQATEKILGILVNSLYQIKMGNKAMIPVESIPKQPPSITLRLRNLMRDKMNSFSSSSKCIIKILFFYEDCQVLCGDSDKITK